MPSLTRWFLKTALVHLVGALLLGVLIAAPGTLPIPQQVVVLTPVYFHLLMVGWVTQMIFGVAYWMFPRRHLEAGHERLGWVTYVGLNAGLLLRAVGEPCAALRAGTWGWMLVASALLQLVAVAAFVAAIWPRVAER